jgi:cytochrome b involved in lipid metabolism
MVIRGVAYDVTSYLKIHPGGDVIFQGAGKDGTFEFEEAHKWVNEKYILKGMEVGVLDDDENNDYDS